MRLEFWARCFVDFLGSWAAEVYGAIRAWPVVCCSACWWNNNAEGCGIEVRVDDDHVDRKVLFNEEGWSPGFN